MGANVPADERLDVGLMDLGMDVGCVRRFGSIGEGVELVDRVDRVRGFGSSSLSGFANKLVPRFLLPLSRWIIETTFNGLISLCSHFS